MSDTEAREFLEGIRWPSGPICPKCGSVGGAWKLSSKPDAKHKVRPGLYRCKDCKKNFTVTMGTIFEDTHIPLNKWLAAIFLLNSSKKGISAHQLHRMLGVTYKSAWFMCHRIRLAMTQEPLNGLLEGVVEVDETYVGGKASNMNNARRRRFAAENPKSYSVNKIDNKTPVFALAQRGGELRAQKLKTVSGKTVSGIIRRSVSRDATIMSDAALMYTGLRFYHTDHLSVDHSEREYARGDAHVNTLEGWFSLLKRGVMGTFHHVSEQHLDRYVDEFVFRYNNRKMTDAERARKAIKATGGKRLIYKEATKKAG